MKCGFNPEIPVIVQSLDTALQGSGCHQEKALPGYMWDRKLSASSSTQELADMVFGYVSVQHQLQRAGSC
jgi:hypothetical protein